MEWSDDDIKDAVDRAFGIDGDIGRLTLGQVRSIMTRAVDLYLSRVSSLAANDEASVRSVLIATGAGAVVKNVKADHAALSRLAALARETESLRAALAQETERANAMERGIIRADREAAELRERVAALEAQLATERAGDLQLRQDLGAALDETLRGAAMRVMRERDDARGDLAAARSHVCPARWDLIP
jgi:septal ring factor EnvC (AmiA/AmiB activator)